MSNVDQIHNAVLLFSNPTWSSDISVPATTVRNVSSITPDLAYSETIDYNITTISSRYAETDNGVIQGFLYLPTLQTTDYCYEWSQKNIPQNVTHRTDLPPSDLRRIAIAPWVDIECTQDYLLAARNEGIRALIFYRPGGKTNSKPRPGNDIIWALDDSFLWKEQNHFPVYAVPSLVGEQIVDRLSQYNGAVSNVPNGSAIAEVYEPNEGDYIRIWTEISVSTNSKLPQVWIFVLAILAIIGGVIFMISCGMHAIHYRRRKALRRRVQNGKVDLEALGIKKIPIPRWAVNDRNLWPLLQYSPFDIPETAQPPHSPMSNAFSPLAGLSREAQRTMYPIDHQPRCELCTRYFQKMGRLIKEAPCGHIFDPKCIDEYTLRSSLCPLCKTCLLPKNWSPRITNAMVRRERSIRKCREVIEIDSEEECNSRIRRPEHMLSPAPSISSSGEHPGIGLVSINRGQAAGGPQRSRPSQPRQTWSRTSTRRTPPLNHLPTVSEAEGHFPPLPPSPASSQMPMAPSPDSFTRPAIGPPSQPSPLPLPPEPAVTQDTSGDHVINIEPVINDHPAMELERVRPSPSSSTRRRRIRQFLGPDLDDESTQHPVARAFRKVFPGI